MKLCGLKKEEKKPLDYSKRILRDVRALLWIVTVGGLILAFLCIQKGYLGSLPWIGTMVGLPWTAYGTVASFYMNMSKSDHRAGGITYEAAKAGNFGIESSGGGTLGGSAPQTAYSNDGVPI